MRKFILACALVILPLAGCGGMQGNKVANQAGGLARNATTGANQGVQYLNRGNVHDMRIANNIATGLVKSHLVKSAYVFVVGNVAYVAVGTSKPSQITMSMKEKDQIGKKAKQLDHHIKTVYVSADPKLYHHFQGFANDVSKGRPISGLWNAFSASIREAFPTVH